MKNQRVYKTSEEERAIRRVYMERWWKKQSKRDIEKRKQRTKEYQRKWVADKIAQGFKHRYIDGHWQWVKEGS